MISNLHPNPSRGCWRAFLEHQTTGPGESKEVNLGESQYSVGETVKDNKSSMMQDVMPGKTPKVQEFIGWLVDSAAYLGGLDPEPDRAFGTRHRSGKKHSSADISSPDDE